MRVVREASTFTDAEVVEHEERGEVAERRCPNGPPDNSTNTLLGFDRENALHDGSGDTGHGLWL